MYIYIYVYHVVSLVYMYKYDSHTHLSSKWGVCNKQPVLMVQDPTWHICNHQHISDIMACFDFFWDSGWKTNWQSFSLAGTIFRTSQGRMLPLRNRTKRYYVSNITSLLDKARSFENPRSFSNPNPRLFKSNLLLVYCNSNFGWYKRAFCWQMALHVYI